MPKFGTTWTAVRAALIADIAAAWPEMSSVYFGTRKEAPESLPYVQVTPEPVMMSWGRLQGLDQKLTFKILGRWPYPATPPEDLVAWRLAKADLLIEELESATGYASLGEIPTTSALVLDQDDYSENALDVELEFQITVDATYGS